MELFPSRKYEQFYSTRHGKIGDVKFSQSPSQPAGKAQGSAHHAAPSGSVHHHISRRSVLSLAALAGTVGVGGCEIRLGSGSRASLPERSDDELIRDSLARRTALLSSIASVLTASSDTQIAEIASTIQNHTATQLAALGGVWDPWPSGAPSGYPTVHPAPTADSSATPDVLISTLIDSCLQARSACATVTSTDTARLYAALAIDWGWHAQWLNPGSLATAPRFQPIPESSVLATMAPALWDHPTHNNQSAEETPVPPSDEPDSSPSSPTSPAPIPLPAPSALTTQGQQLTADIEAQYAQVMALYDQCRYFSQTLAAKTTDSTRLAAIDDADVALSVVSTWSQVSNVDKRLAAYALPQSSPPDNSWGIAAWTPIVNGELGLLATEGVNRVNVIDAALDAASRALAWGAVPESALPGITS